MNDMNSFFLDFPRFFCVKNYNWQNKLYLVGLGIISNSLIFTVPIYFFKTGAHLCHPIHIFTPGLPRVLETFDPAIPDREEHLLLFKSYRN